MSQMKPWPSLLHPIHPALQSGTLTSGVARCLLDLGLVNTMVVRNINYELKRKDLFSCLLFGNILKSVERKFFFLLFKIFILPILGLRRHVQPKHCPPGTSLILTTLKSIANKSLYRAHKRRLTFFLISLLFLYVCLSSSYEWKAKMSTGNATFEWQVHLRRNCFLEVATPLSSHSRSAKFRTPVQKLLPCKTFQD